MDTQQRNRAASLEGRRVNLALRGGARIDDCQLVSAGGGQLKRLWVFTNGQDAFIPVTEVVDLWEAVPAHQAKRTFPSRPAWAACARASRHL